MYSVLSQSNDWLKVIAKCLRLRGLTESTDPVRSKRKYALVSEKQPGIEEGAGNITW